jgi:hypothetical protein
MPLLDVFLLREFEASGDEGWWHPELKAVYHDIIMAAYQSSRQARSARLMGQDGKMRPLSSEQASEEIQACRKLFSKTVGKLAFHLHNLVKKGELGSEQTDLLVNSGEPFDWKTEMKRNKDNCMEPEDVLQGFWSGHLTERKP